jgi:hypothetical protein
MGSNRYSSECSAFVAKRDIVEMIREMIGER